MLKDPEGSRKIPFEKILPRKIPSHPLIKCRPEKFSRKISTWNILTHFINCLSSLNTAPINVWENILGEIS